LNGHESTVVTRAVRGNIFSGDEIRS
jgi:hypothetical protein